MLNSVSANALYGLADPLQWYANQQKISGQIKTNDFEQVHSRSVAGSGGASGESGIKPSVDRDPAAVAEELWHIQESRYNRVARALPEASLDKATPAQAAEVYRRVNELLITSTGARDAANKTKSISVYA